MPDLDLFHGNEEDTVFRDVIMLALAGFVAIVILLLPHLHPPTSGDASVDPPGNVVVEIRWADGLPTDVDLWVEAPGDAPVGYSNKGGEIFNLLRDDLGQITDTTNLNYEVAFSRGVPTGEYTVNVHLYSNHAPTLPIKVSVVASIKTDMQQSLRPLVKTDIELVKVGEELTAFRFSLDEQGNLVPDSVHNLQRPLRSRKS